MQKDENITSNKMLKKLYVKSSDLVHLNKKLVDLESKTDKIFEMIPNYPTAEDNLYKKIMLKNQQSKINKLNEIDYKR